MKARVREAALFFLWINSSVALFNKCCPEGEIVQVDSFEDNDLSPRNHFSCVSVSQNRVNQKKKRRESDEYAISNSSSTISQLITYNVAIDENSHWPSCGENSLLSSAFLDEAVKGSESASCIDVLHKSYHIFSCDESLDSVNDYVDIYKLRKCCSKNFSYDVFLRQCVPNNETSVDHDFQGILLNRVVAFTTGIPECHEDDVLVEYHSMVHKFKLYDNSLIITGLSGYGPDVLPEYSYCLESTMNSDADLPDGDKPEHHHLKKSSKWIAKVCRNKVICERMPCVRKCCKEGQRMVSDNETYCEDHHAHLGMKFHAFKIEDTQEDPNALEPSEYGILMPKHCEKFHLKREEDKYFHSAVDGSLFVPGWEEFYRNDEYCVDYYYKKSEVDPSADVIKVETLVCFDDEETDKIKIKFYIYATLLAISAGFLGVTFLVYIFLVTPLNLHGKTLVCHVLSLFVAYSSLSFVQFKTEVMFPLCKCIGFIVFFGFLSAFSWLNVMCIDIYYTFGSIRMAHGMRKAKDLKRFVYYSVYAWGFPCLMTIFTYMMDTYNLIDSKYRPNIGESSCWFENASLGHLMFFLLPVGIQISINIVLFIITAIYCNRVKSEIHRMQMIDNCEQKKKRYIADKAIFLMNLKLFIVMGISWLIEIIDTAMDHHLYWSYVIDAVNLFQGVLVFFIFVFKKKVLMALQKKLGIRVMGARRKMQASSVSTNMSTLDLSTTATRMMKSNSSTTLTTNVNFSMSKH